MSKKIPPELDLLTPKQRDFVLAYVETKNATKAAKIAGYRGNQKTLGAVGSENLEKPLIRQAIDAITRKTTEKAIISIETVVTELASIGFASEEKFQYYDKYGNLRFAFADKTHALKLLGDHVGAFKNANEPDGGTHLHLHGDIDAETARETLRSLLKR